jgi:hypothetical protein
MPFPDSEYPSVLRGKDKRESQRLAAAAPELLAALKEAAQELSLVCKWFDHPEQTTTETLRRATSAINKAEGRGE